MKQKYLMALALAGALLVPETAVIAEETNRWSWDVTPYLWVAGVDVETSLSGTSSGVDRFDTRISAGAMLAAEVRYRSVGLLVDFAWLQLDTEAMDPGPLYSGVNLKSDFIHTTAALAYRLPLQGKFHAEVLAGARFWYVNEDLEFTKGLLPGFKSSAEKTWVDPLIGASLSYDLSKNWSLVTKGTLGGFGVSADIAWEVFGGVNYRVTDWFSTTLGYRYLHEDYSRDHFNLNLDAHGFLLGFGFHF